MRLHTAGDFGALIRGRRTRLQFSQAQLARKVGVGRQWVVELEKGKPRAPLALVLRTLNALGVALRTDDGAGKAKRTKRAKEPAKSPDIDGILERLRRKSK